MFHAKPIKLYSDEHKVKLTSALVYQKWNEREKILHDKGQADFERAIAYFKKNPNCVKIRKSGKAASAYHKHISKNKRFKRSYMKEADGEIYALGHGCIYHREVPIFPFF